MFSSRNFSLTFRFLIHFDFIFLYTVLENALISFFYCGCPHLSYFKLACVNREESAHKQNMKLEEKIIITLLCIATSSHNQICSSILVQLGKSDYVGSKVLFTTRIGLAWPSFTFSVPQRLNSKTNSQ